MIRLCVRFYSQNCRSPPRGCRVLDYTTPKTHWSVRNPQFLLGARMGMRYANADPHFDDREELLTIMHMHERAPDLRNQPEFANFYENARARAAVFPSSLNSSRIHQLTDVVLAPSLAKALALLAARASEFVVPPFVALHTLARHAKSPLDVHNALRQFEQWLPLLPAHYQPELAVLMLRMAQQHLVDLVPSTVELLLRHAPQVAAQPVIVNELLWQIAQYGKRWSLVDTPVLSAAQELVIKSSGVKNIDLKGLVSLAYVKHFRHPRQTREILTQLQPEVAARTPEKSRNELPYAVGPLLIEILTCESPQRALLLVERATTHLPAVWNALALYLKRSQTLSASVAPQLWTSLLSRGNVRPSALLLELVLGACPNFATKEHILNEAKRRGLRVTPAVVAAMMRVATASELDLAKHVFADYANHPRVQEQVLQTESQCDPTRVWQTYLNLVTPSSSATSSAAPPSRRALQSLCRAAWDPTLRWDNVYAAQRALREIKLWVRGAAAPADDVLRVFPTDELLYAYLVMVGRADYKNELIDFLPWMRAIQHQPSKRVLLALCYFSPQGPALLKMGQQVPGWPTYDEYAVYETQL